MNKPDPPKRWLKVILDGANIFSKPLRYIPTFRVHGHREGITDGCVLDHRHGAIPADPYFLIGAGSREGDPTVIKQKFSGGLLLVFICS